MIYRVTGKCTERIDGTGDFYLRDGSRITGRRLDAPAKYYLLLGDDDDDEKRERGGGRGREKERERERREEK